MEGWGKERIGEGKIGEPAKAKRCRGSVYPVISRDERPNPIPELPVSETPTLKHL